MEDKTGCGPMLTHDSSVMLLMGEICHVYRVDW